MEMLVGGVKEGGKGRVSGRGGEGEKERKNPALLLVISYSGHSRKSGAFFLDVYITFYFYFFLYILLFFVAPFLSYFFPPVAA